jgi:hypothetical protein
MWAAKTHGLTKKTTEVHEKCDAVSKQCDAVSKQIDKKIAPVQKDFDDALTKVNSSQQIMKKVIEEGEIEIKKMSEDIDSFVEEIQRMKDIIRERTIDLEL